MSSADRTHPSSTDLSKRLVNIRQRSEEIEDRMRAACHEARLLSDEHAALSSATRTSSEAEHTRQLNALRQRAEDIEDRMNSIHNEADVAAKNAAECLLACDSVEVDDEPPVDLFPATEGVLIPELLEDNSGEAAEGTKHKARPKTRQEVDHLPYPWFPEYDGHIAPPQTEMELLLVDATNFEEREVLYSPWRPTTAQSWAGHTNVAPELQAVQQQIPREAARISTPSAIGLERTQYPRLSYLRRPPAAN